MNDLDGGDLLRVFEQLDVKLLSLNPNVVKAWFDTDDKNMKNLLTWMCESLSKENYITPIELGEYSLIKNPLSDEELEKEKELCDQKYPGIFDKELNALEIQFLEDEICLARQQEKELEESILLNRNLEGKLSENFSIKLKVEIEVSVKLKTTQEKCLEASEKLDSLNKKIHEQLVSSSDILHNIEFSYTPTFISNFEIRSYEEKLDNILSILKPKLDKTYCGNFTTLLDPTSPGAALMDQTVDENLNTMRHRILHSQYWYSLITVEVAKLKTILDCLDNFSIESLLSVDANELSQSIALKTDAKTKLFDMLEDAIKKYADRHISKAQVKYIEQELEMHQKNLQELSDLENMIQELLAHYSLLGIMYNIEKQDIQNYENYFKQVRNYIGRDMENSVCRTEKMKEIIHCQKDSAGQENLKVINTVIQMLSNKEENVSIGRAYELLSEFKKEVEHLETKLFLPGFADVKVRGKKLRDSIKVLQSFLVSGPTHRVLIVPTKLQIVMRQVDELLEKELKSVKSAMNVVSTTKAIPTKWQNYRRQLWMYFYADPKGLKYVLEEIKKEFESSKAIKN